MLAAFERHDGSHLVVLAISGKDNVLTTLVHDNQGGIVVKAQNDSGKEESVRLVVAVGKALSNAMAAVMYHARKLVMRYDTGTDEPNAEMQTLMEDFDPQWLENWCKFSFSRQKPCSDIGF